MLNKNLLGISLVLMLIITNVHCGCTEDDDKTKNSSEESGEVNKFLKNVGCTLQKGAEKVSEGAKKLGEGAKKLGQNIKEKFNEYKDKLTSDDNNAESNTKVPLASSMAQLPPVPQRPLPLAPLKEEKDQPNNFDLRMQN